MRAKLSDTVLGVSSELEGKARFVPLTFRHFVSPDVAHCACRILCSADANLQSVRSQRATPAPAAS